MNNTTIITLFGEEFMVDFYYDAGTNYVITSTSLQPNDPEVLEVECLRHNTLPKEFCDQICDDYAEQIADLVYEQIKG